MGNEGSKHLEDRIAELEKKAQETAELEKKAQETAELEKKAKEATLENTEENKTAVAETPWREMEEDFAWSSEYEEKLIKAVEVYDTGDAVKNPRLLLVGPINAGKSSVINSVATIDKGRIAEVVRVGDEDKSMTTKLKVYRPSRRLKNFRILDTMGIEEVEGFNVEDIGDLVTGKLKSNYKFNTRSKGNETELRKNVKQKYKVHCIVVVVDANNIGKGNISEATQDKINLLRQKIKDEEIPLVILLTKIDLLCKGVQCDITDVFRSKAVEQAVKMARDIFKVPERNIYPIQNYSKETRTEPKLNILILLALRQMLDYATDYLNELNMATSSDEEEAEEVY